jgi:hypothetical protein
MIAKFYSENLEDRSLLTLRHRWGEIINIHTKTNTFVN